MSSVADQYTYRVGWSEEDSSHVSNCLEFPSLAAHGNSPEKALHEIKKVVAASVRWMKKNREVIPEPFGRREFRGSLTLRVPPEVHRELAIKSAEQGVSINQYILSRVSRH